MQALSESLRVAFHTGRFIPIIGFGTYKLTGDVCYNAILEALRTG